MSDTETHIGKLRRIDILSKNKEHFADIDIETYIKEKCLQEGYEKESYHDSWLEVWNEYHYKEKGYIIEKNGEYYEIVSDVDVEEDDICHIVDNKDGTYDYVMRFYNGGTCLSEMLEESL